MEHEDILKLNTELQQLITTDQAWQYSIIPKSYDNEKYVFYIDEDKISLDLINELELLFGKKVELLKTSSHIINVTLGKHYRKGNKKESRKTWINYNSNSDDFLNNLIGEANAIGSSDIHIEAYENSCRVRMRIDGKLVERYILNPSDYPALINKIKIKSNLDIAEKRLPQDGRINFISGTSRFDIRVSILPALYGEKAVLRLLSKDSTNIDIEALGFNQLQLDQYLQAIRKPHGIILISGPTGSGKTTTLYATLKILNSEAANILTIEDPVEYTLDGINQVQLKESIGLTFASALRTFLRQDPDIIMLGEIRDGETAHMAIRAALTGHLVLSTIHTNSAWGTINRLIDMGIPSFLIANTINLTAAQRLVRILCPDCKKLESFSKSLYPSSYSQPRQISKHYVAKGCDKCYYTGYKGRKALYEVIPIDYELSEIIRQGKNSAEDVFSRYKITSLSDSAFKLFENGDTSIEEVYSLLMNNI
ncbi:MAG TPA: GspE/PulE family protein [Bacteroidales bacterium]|jgi:general secretion pathway protein E/type IV pilus assembly protein PilB|nr:GspE/PulE family protein [Bacteroidales bacterium]